MAEQTAAAADNRKRISLAELGATGLQRYGGIVAEEFLPQLQGTRGVKIYREMRDNDPIIGSLLFVIDMMIRRVTWFVEPESSAREDEAAADFVKSCKVDMSTSWEDLISEIMSMLTYGWSFHEIVYKKREGDVRDGSKRSRYSDGLYGWRKIPIRGQDTLTEWGFDESGGIQSMIQQPPPDFDQRTIPLSKGLLFRTTTHKNNPEGRSILRNAYRPWYFKRRIEEIEGMGIERDLAGLPVMWVPPELLSVDASPDEHALLANLKKIVRNVRRDNQEGMILPLAYTDGGQLLFKFELLSSGGLRQFDTSSVIYRYNEAIMMTALADFVLLGHEGYGSYALSADKTNMFELALEAWANMVASVFNQHAIPRLLKMNGFAGQAHLRPGRVDRVNLSELSQFVSTISGVGVRLTERDEDYLRQVGKLPPREPKEEAGYLVEDPHEEASENEGIGEYEE
jgi:hypothetical protein